MIVVKVSKELAEEIGRAGMSPPIMFGRIRRAGVTSDEFYIGIGSEEEMEKELRRKIGL